MIRYAITSGMYEAGDAARLAREGVDYIQLRDKVLPAGEIAALARGILGEIASVPGAVTRLLINARVDIAVAVGADGVHLTSRVGELTPVQVREVFGAVKPVVSVSCHTVEEVARAHALGADLILFGPVFEKRVARQFITDGSGLGMLRRACVAGAGTPVLALGGITAENAADCVEVGAAGIAAIRLFA